MAMLIDLILKPEANKRGGKIFLWMDNFSAHKVNVLDPIFKEANILQVLDLVVNGPLKAHIRQLRASRIYQYFQEFKVKYNNQLLKPLAERILPKWSCPKPSLQQCVQDLCELFQPNGSFNTAAFRLSIQKSFIKTCTAYKPDKSFQLYNQNDNKGSMPIIPTGTVRKDEFPEDANYVDLTEWMVEEDNDSVDEREEEK
jgi:hypothetical protein